MEITFNYSKKSITFIKYMYCIINVMMVEIRHHAVCLSYVTQTTNTLFHCFSLFGGGWLWSILSINQFCVWLSLLFWPIYSWMSLFCFVYRPLRFIEKFLADNVYPFYANTHTTTTITSKQTTRFRHESRWVHNLIS